MEPQNIQRKLTAILSADVKGYSRLMGEDEVAQKIVAALAVTLTEDEQKRLVHRETDNLEAFDYYLRAGEYKNRFTKEANVQARQMFERAITLDSRFALAYAGLALTHVDDWCMGWREDPQSLECGRLGQSPLCLP